MLGQVREMIQTIETQKGVTMKDVKEQAARLEAVESGKAGATTGNGASGNDEDAWEDDDDEDEDEEMS